jgi:hypothetical protein
MGIKIDGTELAKAIKLLSDVTGKSYIDNFRVQVNKRSPFKLCFEIMEDDIPMAGFTLIEQVNCCGMLVSTRTFVLSKFQGEGCAQEMMELKDALAKEFGYSALLATVDVGNNPAEVHILEKCGWSKVKEFINKRTKPTLGVFIKVL